MSRQRQPRSPQGQVQPRRRTDRRDATAPRRRYEGLVEVGSDSLGGFEAEAVDVSLDGMRMRTAYVPRPGERLVCRFDGYEGEIVAAGEVVWTEREGRGGELGLRFTGLERRGVHLLEDLCGEMVEEPAEPSEPSGAPPGTRVRLHIDGLGSPMRARVRTTARGEVLVGSNLEFLRVGRRLELEDVERGLARNALIEHVGVEIDPESQVPQLVVAMSYGDAPEEDELTTAPIRVREHLREESTPGPAVIDNEERPAQVEPAGRSDVVDEDPPTPRMTAVEAAEVGTEEELEPRAPLETSARHVEAGEERPRHRDAEAEEQRATEEQPPPRAADDEAECAEPEDDEADAGETVEEEPEGRAAGVVRAASAFAESMKPRLASAGAGARSAVGKVVSNVRARREARREAAESGPKRKTAPPPSGALRSDGKRLIRQQGKAAAAQGQEGDEAPPRNEKPGQKRRATVGALLGAVAVVGIYVASSQLQQEEGQASADPSVAATASATASGQLPPGVSSPAGHAGRGAATANVPLYGTTPMSTTEPVPVPPKPGEAKKKEEAEEQAPSPVAGEELEKEWGVGEVTNPTVLRLKMDGKIAGFVGKETNTGFTIVVPKRKSISSAAGLTRRDDRLDSVDVVNYPNRAEITLHFKGEIPPFVTRARGKRIIIEIATDGEDD